MRSRHPTLATADHLGTHRERPSSKGQGRPSQQNPIVQGGEKVPVKKCSLQQQLDAKQAKSEKSSATQFATCASVRKCAWVKTVALISGGEREAK